MRLFTEFGVKVINNHTSEMRIKFIIIAFICLFSAHIFGQKTEKGKIGIGYSFGGVSLLSENDFAKSLTPNSSSAASLIYLYPLKMNLELESGLTYSLFNFNKNSETEADTKEFNGNMSLIDLPIGVRATFGKYFFINGGGLIDFTLSNSLPIRSQSGIGLYGGLGIVGDFDFGGSIFLNPYVKLHSLIPFSSWKGQDRILETIGVKFGFTYKL